jgi:hypothetical protein
MPYDEIFVESCMSSSGIAADLVCDSVSPGRSRRGVVEFETAPSSELLLH